MNRRTCIEATVLLLPLLLTSACVGSPDEIDAAASEALSTVAARNPKSTFHAWSASFQAPRSGMGSDPATVAANGMANDDAHNFDLIVDLANKKYPSGKTYDAKTVAAMRQENPRFKFLVYLNGCCIVGPAEQITNFPASAYATTSAGKRLTSADGAPMMNRRDPTWANSRADECKRIMTDFGYDGCFYDSFSARWFIQAGSGTPMDPKTHNTWTVADYTAAGNDILTHVRALNPGKLIGINGLGTGGGYFNTKFNERAMLPPTDIAMAEDFLTGPRNAVTTFETVDKWKQQVAMVEDVISRGKIFLATTKLWANASAAQEEQWSKFAEGTLLLATDSPNAYLNFQNEHGSNATTQYYPWYNVILGSATGSSYTQSGSCFVRQYQQGTVVVNPSSSGSCTVALGGAHTDLDGRVVSTAVVSGHSANIYVR